MNTHYNRTTTTPSRANVFRVADAFALLLPWIVLLFVDTARYVPTVGLIGMLVLVVGGRPGFVGRHFLSVLLLSLFGGSFFVIPLSLVLAGLVAFVFDTQVPTVSINFDTHPETDPIAAYHEHLVDGVVFADISPSMQLGHPRGKALRF